MTTQLLSLVLAVSPFPATYDAEISAAVADVAEVWVVPPALVKAVIRRESAFNPKARSKAGAIGLMQVMPFNAARLGFTEKQLWDPAKNILAGVRLLAVLLKHYDGDLISALVAYNAGPRRLAAPIPRNGETPAYVKAVLAYFCEAQLEANTSATMRSSLNPSKAAVPPHR